jgi:hypothetical protein
MRPRLTATHAGWRRLTCTPSVSRVVDAIVVRVAGPGGPRTSAVVTPRHLKEVP